MQIDQELRDAKHHFDPKFNQDEFRDNVIRMVSLKESKPLKQKFSFKRKSVLIGFAATAIPVLAGFSYLSFEWHNGMFQFDQSPTTSQVPSISETLQGYMHPSKVPHPKNTTVKKVTLSQARAIAIFPIVEPKNIPGWNKVFSSGMDIAIQSSQNNNTRSNDNQRAVTYLDEYTNGSNEKVLVMQQQDSVMTASSQTPWMSPTIKYPSNSERINFGRNFGVYIPNENFLHVYDSTGSQVIGIYVWGTTSKENLETIAKAYLSASTK